MDSKIKTKWVKALRSGKYQQTRKTLRRLDKNNKPTYCCLGVLCDLYAKAKKLKWKKRDADNVFFLGKFNDTTFLPHEVVSWAGLRSSDPIVNEVNLTTLNDSRKCSFKKIADLIEKELKQI